MWKGITIIDDQRLSSSPCMETIMHIAAMIRPSKAPVLIMFYGLIHSHNEQNTLFL